MGSCDNIHCIEPWHYDRLETNLRTIGEKIGKENLSYAQGATAEIVALPTIGLSTAFGLPVSTTHVLSSGVAGAMTASKEELTSTVILSSVLLMHGC